MFAVPCSYGELVDKVTILRIKLAKSQNQTQTNNIHLEYTQLVPMIIDKNEPIISQLYLVNQALWDLEDKIRDLSNAQTFNKEYIECAEMIHKTNDQRYHLKKVLNQKYNSEIKEEKIYTQSKDWNQILNDVLVLFETEPLQSYSIMKSTMSEWRNIPTRLLVVYYLNFLNISNYIGESCYVKGLDIDQIISLIKSGHISGNINSVNIHLAIELLRLSRYQDAQPYLPYLQSATGPNGVSPKNVGYFAETDENKTMLLYTAGGLGDIIMFGRFLPEFCKHNSKNKIILFCCNSLLWMFESLNNHWKLDNLTVSKFTVNMPCYDYHNNIGTLFSSLGHTTKSLKENYIPYLHELKGGDFEIPEKPYILFGWKGNEENSHELHNRRVPLEPLLKAITKSNQNLVTTQRDITEQERILLEQYNVKVITNCDNEGKAFYDTLTLVKNANVVVSSDTALLHLAGCSRSKEQITIGMIVLGCEWRWNKNNSDAWYPDVKVIRQQNFREWSHAMNDLENSLVNL